MTLRSLGFLFVCVLIAAAGGQGCLDLSPDRYRFPCTGGGCDGGADAGGDASVEAPGDGGDAGSVVDADDAGAGDAGVSDAGDLGDGGLCLPNVCRGCCMGSACVPASQAPINCGCELGFRPCESGCCQWAVARTALDPLPLGLGQTCFTLNAERVALYASVRRDVGFEVSRFSPDGGAIVELVDPSGEDASGCALATAPNGNVALALWSQLHRAWYLKAQSPGAGWAGESVGPSAGRPESYRTPSLRYDAQSALHVASLVIDVSAPYLTHDSQLADGGWRSEAKYLRSDYLSMDVDAEGGVHVSSYDSIANSINYTFLKNGTFTTETLVVSPFRRTSSLRVDAAGRPHLFYVNGTNQLIHAVKRGQWMKEVVAEESDGLSEAAAVIAPGDVPAVAYYHYPSETIRLAVSAETGGRTELLAQLPGASSASPVLGVTKEGAFVVGWMDTKRKELVVVR